MKIEQLCQDTRRKFHSLCFAKATHDSHIFVTHWQNGSLSQATRTEGLPSLHISPLKFAVTSETQFTIITVC